MAETTVHAEVTGLIPMAHVVDVQRSIDFYKLLGMELRGSLKASDSSALRWAHVACEHADLMFARASGPIVASDQDVLFYLYSPNLIALREKFSPRVRTLRTLLTLTTCPRAKSASKIRMVTCC